jgi:hypothetical protein
LGRISQVLSLDPQVVKDAAKQFLGKEFRISNSDSDMEVEDNCTLPPELIVCVHSPSSSPCPDSSAFGHFSGLLSPPPSRSSSPTDALHDQIVQLEQQNKDLEEIKENLTKELTERQCELVVTDQNRDFFEAQALDLKEDCYNLTEKCCCMFSIFVIFFSDLFL